MFTTVHLYVVDSYAISLDSTDLHHDLRKLIARRLRCTFRFCVKRVVLMTDGRSHYVKALAYLNV